MKKRIISALLAVVMLIGMMPVMVTEAEAASYDVINANGVTGEDIVAKAREYLDFPYAYSDNYKIRTGFGNPVKFDCSGLVYRVCREVGLASSRENYDMNTNDHEGKPLEGKDSNGNYYITAHTQEQRYYGEDIDTIVKKYMDSGDYSELRQGDLLFLTAGEKNKDGSTKVSHVVIYAGNGKIIHSEWSKSGNGKVREDSIHRYGGTKNAGKGVWTSTDNWYFNACRLVEPNLDIYLKEGKCKSYPAYGTIKITTACNPFTLPCNSDTAKKYNCVSEELKEKALKIGDEVTVNGIVYNSENHYWYKVTLKDGTPAWVYSARAKGMTSKNPYVSGSILPDSISGSHALSGTIINDGARLEKVWAEVQNSKGEKVIPSDVHTVATTSNYGLGGSKVDNSLKFETLKNYGNASYKLVVFAEVTNYYLNAKNELKQVSPKTLQVGSDAFSFTTSGGSGGNTSGTYTVEFMANGGTCSTSTLSVAKGKTIGALPDAGFGLMEFLGWYTAPYGGTEVTASTVPTGNMTVWAHYSNPEYPQRLNFDPMGGKFSEPVYRKTIDGVNRDRPAESLVVFNQSRTKVETNKYGVEVAVNSGGKVTDVRLYGSETKLTVPTDGFVLSGNRAGATLVEQIIALDEAYVHVDYETGEVQVYDSYGSYLAEIKRGEEYTRLGVLPVPVREGYVFRRWTDGDGYPVDYYSGFAGIYYYAEWDKETDLYPEATLEYNGHYYELYDYNVSWTKAKELCEAMGGHLVTITDASEQAQIVSLIAEGSRGMYRIGATDIETEGTWKWVTGEKFSYNNWDTQAPEPSGKEVENYAQIIAIENLPNKQVGEWLDDHSASYGTFYDISNTGFICEYEQLQGCEHEYQNIITKPTCEQGGFTIHTCTSCGDIYMDNFKDPLGHEYTGAVVEPTCTEKGYTIHICISCGDSYMTDEVAELNHSIGDWTVVEEATCTENGVQRRDCSRCDYFETETIEATGHQYDSAVTDPTCTEKGYTTHTCKCGDSYVDTYVDALDHKWDAGVVTKEPTEDEEGTKVFTCERCGETREETLPKLDHVHEYTSVVTDPTCTEKGYTTHTCKCGDSFVDTYVDPLDHKWDAGVVTKEPTEDEEGTKLFTCERCEETKEETLPKLDHIHVYTSVVTEPTYTEKGYTTHICSCGDSYVDSYVDPLPMPEAEVAVARMILGNELAMQFAFPKENIVEGVDYVVSVTKTYADGRADKNILVPQSEWKTNGPYYYVSFNGIAAKEMGDTINVQILTAEGVTVGDVYTDSVQNYAIRQLQKTTDAKIRTLYVDMLNYGAAAQTYFKYDAENLVTDGLTPEEMAYGTKEVKLENNLVKGPGYGASQLNLASSIQLRVKFNGIDSSMYAIVKFTNHMGREIEERVEGSEFMYSGTVVVIDDVVAADYDRDVTITVYDADGKAVANAVESVASYIARMSGGAEIYSAVAKYCAAAHAYLHRND